MSSRNSIQHFISLYEPVGSQVGDEWYNPATSTLYKRTLVNGVISWANIGSLSGPGATGPGATGATGVQGASGARGATGSTGPTGATGLTGATGSQGIQGASGSTGLTGATGSTGVFGASGVQGASGTLGATGSTGPQGNVGATGSTGPQGNVGATGSTGPQGNVGATGSTGVQGASGTLGATGSTGPQGNVGATGSTGVFGASGIQGASGSTGIKGGVRYNFSTTTTDADPGIGVVRYDNATIGSVTNIFIDELDVNSANLSLWFDTFDDATNSHRGILTIIGNTTTTVNQFNVTGSVVSVTGYKKIPVTFVSGTLPSNNEQLVISFSRTGNQGATGSTGPIGLTGATGSTGIQGASGSTGLTGATGPQGNVGATGSTGVQGASGTLGATGSTGPQGNVGATGSTGPQGNVGATGSTGVQGASGTLGATGSTGPQGNVGATGSTGPQGNVGATGSTGAQGASGSTGIKGGVRYNFSTTTTDADPGTGTLQYNNATIASVTNIFIDELDVNSANLSLWLDTFDDALNSHEGVLTILGNTTTTVNQFNVTGAVVSVTGYKKIPVTYISGTLPSNSEQLVISFSRTGNQGATGSTGPQGNVGATGSTGPQGNVGATGSTGPAGATGSTGPAGASGATGVQGASGSTGIKGGVRYNFSTTTTDADPGTGVLRYNNATIASVTNIFIDELDVNSANLSFWFDTFDDALNSHEGILEILGNTTTTVNQFNVTGAIVSVAGYKKIPVTFVSGTLPSNNEQLVIGFSRTGNQGATGSTGVQGASGSIGATGSTGPQGNVGATGSTGPAGASGATGVVPANMVTTDTAQTISGVKTFTAAQIFRATNAIISQAAATQDYIVIAGRAGGTGNFAATITTTTLAANVTHTLPAVTGTLVSGGNLAQTLSGAITFGNSATFNGVISASGDTSTIELGHSLTTGTLIAGGTSQTGIMTLGRSTVNSTVGIATGGTNSANTKTVNLGTAGTSGSITNISYGSSVAGSTTTHFWNSGGGEAMRLNATGLGVGTASPAFKLDVIGAIRAQAAATQDGIILLGRAGGGSTRAVTITPTILTADRTYTLPDVANADFVMTQGTQSIAGTKIFSGPITFSNAVDVTAGNFTISSVGVINIGTGLTTSALNFGATGQTGTITLGQSTSSQTVNIATGAVGSGNTKTINIGTNGVNGSTTNINYGSASATSNTTHTWYANSTQTMTMLSNGNLGIGTASPGVKVDVVGAIRATGDITAFYSSDIKFKDNINDIENAVDKVVSIGGKTFEWTDDYLNANGGEDSYFNRKKDFGVIAQDVKESFPLAIRTRADGTLAVDYEKLVALAFQAIKEQQIIIDSLKVRLAALENKAD